MSHLYTKGSLPSKVSALHPPSSYTSGNAGCKDIKVNQTTPLKLEQDTEAYAWTHMRHMSGTSDMHSGLRVLLDQ